MKISHLVEYTVDEAFSDMDQKAKNIQAGKGNATDAELRQKRIAQLAANQKIRNTAPAGRPMAAPAQQAAAPAAQQAADQKAPAQQTAPAANTQPAAQEPADQKAPAAEPTGIIDKFKQGWAKARGSAPAADQKEPASTAGASSAELKQIAQIQQEIQLDIADLKKQVAALSSAAAPAQPAPAESVIINGKNLSEQLAQKVQQQKRRLFKEQLSSGQTGIFVR